MTKLPSQIARDRQRHAADPTRSVWVSASAGTGKTRVLIDRVLRLLLPHTDGTLGTRPDRILCLTYTRAAATEMTERLLSRLSRWVILPDKELLHELMDLLGTIPVADQINAARRLFAHLVDGPEQVRIMTIHAFCQSILARFPLESGLPPHFELVQGVAADELLRAAQVDVLRRSGSDSELRTHLESVLSEINDESFSALLSELFGKNKRQLTYALIHYFGCHRQNVLCSQLNLPVGYTIEKWKDDAKEFVVNHLEDITVLAQVMTGDGTTSRDQELAAFLLDWLSRTPESRLDEINILSDFSYTKEGKRRSSGETQGIRKKRPEIAALYMRVADAIGRLITLRKRIDLVRVNFSLFYIAEQIMGAHDRIKHTRGFLDFDDVIRYTLRLLNVDNRSLATHVLSWVMYKLDGGIDHILVDEAQDTNPEQWAIIRALSTGFFDDIGSGAGKNRTLFVVGDQKQSIYSFQGADPHSFEQSVDHLLAQGNEQTRNVFDRIPLNTSFRSVPAVLHLVDHIFDDESRRAHIRVDDKVTHVVNRVGQGGRVEIWPLETPDETKKEERQGWQAATKVKYGDDVFDRLSVRIAKQIRSWLDTGEKLESYDRLIEPRDIMILVRRREPFLSRLVAALRTQGVPVGGMDRLQLADDLAVRDILSVMKFALLPFDDLNLACLLKSPFINYIDDDLIRLAPGRKGSLWEALKNDASSISVYTYLSGLIDRVQSMRAYSFLSYILSQPCPANPEGSGLKALKARLSISCVEPIDELLSYVLQGDDAGETLLHIIHQLTSENPEIKREGQALRNTVRLMTVHGSKGLESPIVILPDTIRSTQTGQPQSVFWPEDTGKPLPVWSPRADARPDDLQDVLTSAKDAEISEYNRLLYVALTRAQDRLIVAGACKGKADPESWYYAVQAGFDRLQNMPGFTVEGAGDDAKRIYVTPQTAVADHASQGGNTMTSAFTEALPEILRKPLSLEPALSRPYRAEAASGTAVPVSPLLVTNDPHRFRRGLLTHKLLQILPEIDQQKWGSAAKSYLEHRRGDLPDNEIDQIWIEVRNILTHVDFAPVFGPGSKAEVPVAGMLADGRLISGQIDRLLILPDRILIIDYKTNRPPPTDARDVPTVYIRQMGAYRELLAGLYPDRTVQTALIWTDGPRFMDVTPLLTGEKGLETALARPHITGRAV